MSRLFETGKKIDPILIGEEMKKEGSIDSIGGIIAAAAFGALSTFWFFPELPYQFSIPLAIVMAIVGVLGDLAESAMKTRSGSERRCPSSLTLILFIL